MWPLLPLPSAAHNAWRRWLVRWGRCTTQDSWTLAEHAEQALQPLHCCLQAPTALAAEQQQTARDTAPWQTTPAKTNSHTRTCTARRQREVGGGLRSVQPARQLAVHKHALQEPRTGLNTGSNIRAGSGRRCASRMDGRPGQHAATPDGDHRRHIRCRPPADMCKCTCFPTARHQTTR